MYLHTNNFNLWSSYCNLSPWYTNLSGCERSTPRSSTIVQSIIAAWTYCDRNLIQLKHWSCLHFTTLIYAIHLRFRPTIIPTHYIPTEHNPDHPPFWLQFQPTYPASLPPGISDLCSDCHPDCLHLWLQFSPTVPTALSTDYNSNTAMIIPTACFAFPDYNSDHPTPNRPDIQIQTAYISD